MFFLAFCKKDNSLKFKQKELQIPIGHTFFRVDINNEDTLIYKPCDADIAKYILYKDSIFHNWGQEHYTLNILSSIIEDLQIKFKTVYKYNQEIPDGIDSTIVLQQLNKKFWKINGEIFIDSLYISSIKYKMQSCKDCDNCEDNNKEISVIPISEIYNINKQWSNSCDMGVNKDNIIFYSANEISFGISSINFICSATSKQIADNTIEIYLKDSGNDYAPNGEVYSNNNLPKGINFIDCSLTMPIAEVKLVNKYIAEFKWLGFYDINKKKKVYLQNPFTGNIETSSIIIKKCDEQ